MSTFSRATDTAYNPAIGRNANLIVQKWSAEMFKHGLANNPLKNFIGPSTNDVVMVNKDFIKAKGDQITFAMRGLLAANGQGDDGYLEGNEENMAFFNDTVEIHERGHGVLVNGVMTEQRTIIPLRPQAKEALGEWIARTTAADIIAAMSGAPYTLTLAGQITGAQAVQTGGVPGLAGLAPGAAISAAGGAIQTVNGTELSGRRRAAGAAGAMVAGNRIFYGGQNTAGTTFRNFGRDSDLTAADRANQRFGTLVISYVKKIAKMTINPVTGAPLNPIRPIMVDGKEYFLMFIDPDQANDLRQETAWLQAQREANARGKDNPIFSGSLAIWDGVIIHELPLINRRTGLVGQAAASETFDDPAGVAWANPDFVPNGSTVARALFCGAQAGLIGYGQMPNWKEKMHDYGAKFGIATRMIYGTKRPVFNGTDIGVIAVDTNVTPA